MKVATHDVEDHIVRQSEEAAGSIAVSTTLPGPPDEPTLREGFWPDGAPKLAAGWTVALKQLTLTGDHAAAYAEFQLAARELEAAGLAAAAAQRRYQAALAKLSPLAAKAHDVRGTGVTPAAD